MGTLVNVRMSGEKLHSHMYATWHEFTTTRSNTLHAKWRPYDHPMLIGQTSSEERQKPLPSPKPNDVFKWCSRSSGRAKRYNGWCYGWVMRNSCSIFFPLINKFPFREFYERVGSRPELPGVIKNLQPARHSFQKVAFTSWKFNGQNARIRKV